MSEPSSERELLRARTPFNDLRVTRERDLLTLWSPHGTRQTAVSLRTPWLPRLEPARNMAIVLALCPAPRRVLMLGLGGGSVARMLLAAVPALALDAVEVDPAVAAVARRFFGLQPSARLRVRLSDAADYVAAARVGERYDVVLVDTYLGRRFPGSMETDATLGHLRACLSPSGVLAVNVFSGDRDLDRTARRLSSLFAAVWTLPGRRSRNVLVLATASAEPLSAIRARARDRQADLAVPLPLVALAGRLSPWRG